MPQNEYIELAQKRYGKRLNHAEKMYVYIYMRVCMCVCLLFYMQ